MFSIKCVRRSVCRGAAFVTIVAGLAGCGVEKQSAPALTGPSELALALTITAQPDQVVRDGTSRSRITVTARDEKGQPKAGQLLTLSISPSNAGSLTERQVVTQSNGTATFDFIAPPLNTPVPNDQVFVGATPVGDNFDNSVTRTVTIALIPSNRTAPNPSFTVTPETPRLDQPATFDASATTDEGVPCGDTCTYAWDFGGEATASGRVVTYQFKAARQYLVTLRVTDSAGSSASAIRSVTVTAAGEPTADFSFSPTDPAPNETVRFNGSDSRGANGATIVEYLWDFGNGQTATGVTATTTFQNERTYVVRLTVRDSNGGTASRTRDVSVKVP
jgi:PKD repeat protein